MLEIRPRVTGGVLESVVLRMICAVVVTRSIMPDMRVLMGTRALRTEAAIGLVLPARLRCVRRAVVAMAATAAEMMALRAPATTALALEGEVVASEVLVGVAAAAALTAAMMACVSAAEMQAAAMVIVVTAATSVEMMVCVVALTEIPVAPVTMVTVLAVAMRTVRAVAASALDHLADMAVELVTVPYLRSLQLWFSA